jgi:hypothetical protein
MHYTLNHELMTRTLKTQGLDEALRALSIMMPEAAPFAARLACDFAEHLRPVYERWRPRDNRLRDGIEIARRFLRHQATDEELTVAQDDVDLAYGEAIGTRHFADSDEEAELAGAAAVAAGVASDALRIVEDPIRARALIHLLADDTPERERDWLARHLAELLEE